ncbi:hypothetical protein [Mucilaginibacter sp. OK098]|uniref:hypothetical protein n=1 Tax=Mucilaginibacter sp. OK098 TaxID=1855297 RepID=UPI00091E11FF|nr:hypothetical protein [Mucilaginibacter sp. OK098]SHL95174.1 hypothetical protein SAMN05216524_101292 [Mucilaginibacter sp. OK098]
MLFKRTLLSVLLIAFSFICHAQANFELNLRITSGRAFISSIHFTDNNLTIYINRAGRLLLNYDNGNNDDSDFPDEDNRASRQSNTILPALDYYVDTDGDELSGKIKQVGNLQVTYYDRFAWDELRGKVKSIGNVTFTYYDRFGWDELNGKLKSVNNVAITYYDRFDWDELKGKMKTIGNTTITYYDRFGPTERMGSVKNVAGDTPNLNIIWHKSLYYDN